MLKIEKKMEDGACTIALEGRLDTVTSPDFEKEVEEIKEELKDLVLDLEKLEYEQAGRDEGNQCRWSNYGDLRGYGILRYSHNRINSI